MDNCASVVHQLRKLSLAIDRLSKSLSLSLNASSTFKNAQKNLLFLKRFKNFGANFWDKHSNLGTTETGCITADLAILIEHIWAEDCETCIKIHQHRHHTTHPANTLLSPHHLQQTPPKQSSTHFLSPEQILTSGYNDSQKQALTDAGFSYLANQSSYATATLLILYIASFAQKQINNISHTTCSWQLMPHHLVWNIFRKYRTLHY